MIRDWVLHVMNKILSNAYWKSIWHFLECNPVIQQRLRMLHQLQGQLAVHYETGYWIHYRHDSTSYVSELVPRVVSLCKNMNAVVFWIMWLISGSFRVSVQGVKSLGGHFACLCRGFEFHEVKKKNLLLFFKKKMEILLHFLSFL